MYYNNIQVKNQKSMLNFSSNTIKLNGDVYCTHILIKHFFLYKYYNTYSIQIIII